MNFQRTWLFLMSLSSLRKMRFSKVKKLSKLRQQRCSISLIRGHNIRRKWGLITNSLHLSSLTRDSLYQKANKTSNSSSSIGLLEIKTRYSSLKIKRKEAT